MRNTHRPSASTIQLATNTPATGNFKSPSIASRIITDPNLATQRTMRPQRMIATHGTNIQYNQGQRVRRDNLPHVNQHQRPHRGLKCGIRHDQAGPDSTTLYEKPASETSSSSSAYQPGAAEPYNLAVHGGRDYKKRVTPTWAPRQPWTLTGATFAWTRPLGVTQHTVVKTTCVQLAPRPRGAEQAAPRPYNGGD